MSGTKNILNRMMRLTLLASVGFAALLCGVSPASAQTAPPLGVVQQFGVLGYSGVTAAGPAGTIVTGDVGSSPTPSITGFPPAQVAIPFTKHTTNDSVVQQAQIDATTAVSVITPQACTADLTGQDLGTVGTLGPGVYCFSSTAGLTGTLTLDGPGVYIFKIGSAITTAGASNVALSNGADSCNVFWQVGTAATLGASSTFRGTIFAGSSIGLGTTANLVGRAVAQTGAVTMDGSNTIGGCSASVLAPTTLSTQASPGVTLGAAISDTATLSGGATPTGTITFDLYGPNDATCSSAAIFTSTVTVAGNGSYGSTPVFTPTAAGTYRWIANYSGDANNNATANECNAANENVVVTVTPVSTVTPVPTLNEWGVIIFMVLVGLMSIYYLRRQKAKA